MPERRPMGRALLGTRAQHLDSVAEKLAERRDRYFDELPEPSVTPGVMALWTVRHDGSHLPCHFVALDLRTAQIALSLLTPDGHTDCARDLAAALLAADSYRRRYAARV